MWGLIEFLYFSSSFWCPIWVCVGVVHGAKETPPLASDSVACHVLFSGGFLVLDAPFFVPLMGVGQ